MKRVIIISIIATGLGLLSTPADLLTQTDTFDSGTMNWDSGANPVHVATGGAGDNGGFLQVSRPVSAPFHVAAFNKNQWTGNYLAAGITAIEMDLNHIAGPDALNVRLMIWGAGGTWASTSLTPISTGWNRYSFGLTSADLTFVNLDTNGPPTGAGGGTGTATDTLQQVNIFQLRHDYPTPTPPGSHPDHISATLGIDNVQAVPEPATLLYMLVAGGGLMLARARRATHRNTDW